MITPHGGMPTGCSDSGGHGVLLPQLAWPAGSLGIAMCLFQISVLVSEHPIFISLLHVLCNGMHHTGIPCCNFMWNARRKARHGLTPAWCSPQEPCCLARARQRQQRTSCCQRQLRQASTSSTVRRCTQCLSAQRHRAALKPFWAPGSSQSAGARRWQQCTGTVHRCSGTGSHTDCRHCPLGKSVQGRPAMMR